MDFPRVSASRYNYNNWCMCTCMHIECCTLRPVHSTDKGQIGKRTTGDKGLGKGLITGDKGQIGKGLVSINADKGYFCQFVSLIRRFSFSQGSGDTAIRVLFSSPFRLLLGLSSRYDVWCMFSGRSRGRRERRAPPPLSSYTQTHSQ